MKKLLYTTLLSALLLSPVTQATVVHSGASEITNSLGIGGDIYSGYPYSFDTFVLRENNLRILFDDTSTAGGFPSNDWRLEANSSSSGGASYFAIQDATAHRNSFVVEAGARSNALYVDDGGRIGIGTSTPVVDIHAVRGNTPTLRLEQDGSSGFSPQTWDVAGNETNFFVRDVTNGSKLPLRIRPGAPTSSIDIEGTGDVGMGIASPTAPLHVSRTSGTYTGGSPVVRIATPFASSGTRRLLNLENNGEVQFGLTNTAVTNGAWEFKVTAANAFEINRGGSGQVELSIQQNGNVVIGGTTLSVPDYVFDSDYKLMSIDELSSYIETHKHLPGVMTASDVKGEGLNITKLPLQVLEKVEELTLHTIAQQKTINELSARLAELESKARQDARN